MRRLRGKAAKLQDADLEETEITLRDMYKTMSERVSELQEIHAADKEVNQLMMTRVSDLENHLRQLNAVGSGSGA